MASAPEITGHSPTPSSAPPPTGGGGLATPLPIDGETAAVRLPWPKPVLHWYDSWIMRAAGVSALILFLGAMAGIFISMQSTETVARIAHDPAIQKTLDNHLTKLKETHSLTQQVIIERLKPSVVNHVAERGASLDEATLKAWLPHAVRGLDIDLAHVLITPSDTRPDLTMLRNMLKWLDRDHLIVVNLIVTFPKGELYDAFKSAEEVRNRYLLVGDTLRDSIKPSLVRYSIMVAMAGFLLLTGVFFVLARVFKSNVMTVVDGFYRWSEEDSEFRFELSWRGELGLITNQFNAMADEVEANRQKSLYLEKIASWQTIARKLAHEIKNPLTPIQMMVSQLRRRYQPREDQSDKDFVKLLEDAQSIISEEVAGLRRMVDNFSTFARLPLPTPKPTDIVVTVRNVIELQSAAFPQHRIQATTALGAATALVDEDLIRQVLINLIKNGVEAYGTTQTGGHIEVNIRDAGREFAIDVQDNGPGIPGDLQGQIFEAYFTTKHTGPSPGMGLGLAICQKIVLDHGGALSVRSQPGRTVFSMTLPKMNATSIQVSPSLTKQRKEIR